MTRTLIISLALLLPARVAFADDEANKARAKGLFTEAQALSEAGKYAEACQKFEESVELHAGVGNQFNLADCWEKTGRTASAYALFLKVVEATRELKQPEREQAAAARAAALAPKLSRLRIEVQPAKDLSLTRNGEPVAKDDWGKPIPLDPGKYELRASAEGKAPWSSAVDLPAEPVTVVVTVPALEDPKKAVVVAPPPPAPQEKTPKQQAPTKTEESGGGLRSAATLSLLGIGVAGVIAGSVMGAQYATSNSDAKDVCPTGFGCTEDEIARHDELVDDASTARTWMYVGFGAAAAGLAGAALLHFTAPSNKDQPRAGWVGARFFVSREGAVTGALEGAF